MKVPNNNRKFGADPEYVFVKIDGKDALLTPEAADIAITRAEAQPEDLPGLWPRLVVWFRSF